MIESLKIAHLLCQCLNDPETLKLLSVQGNYLYGVKIMVHQQFALLNVEKYVICHSYQLSSTTKKKQRNILTSRIVKIFFYFF